MSFRTYGLTSSKLKTCLIYTHQSQTGGSGAEAVEYVLNKVVNDKIDNSKLNQPKKDGAKWLSEKAISKTRETVEDKVKTSDQSRSKTKSRE